MIPTVGRIVHYRLSQADVEWIDRHVPQLATDDTYRRNPVSAGQVLPAQVVATFGEDAGPTNLVVQLDGPAQFWATSRNEGAEHGQWSWPPQV